MFPEGYSGDFASLIASFDRILLNGIYVSTEAVCLLFHVNFPMTVTFKIFMGK